MSIGFHYFEATKQSLSLQWLSKAEAPAVLGKLIAVGSVTSLIVYSVMWGLLEIFQLDYVWNFCLLGAVCCLGLSYVAGLSAFPGKDHPA